MNRFYCGAVFALAMNHAGHNLIQRVDANSSWHRSKGIWTFVCPADHPLRVMTEKQHMAFGQGDSMWPENDVKCARPEDLIEGGWK